VTSRHPLAILGWILVDATLAVVSATLIVALPAVSVGLVLGPVVGTLFGMLGLGAYFVLSESVFPRTYRVAERNPEVEDDAPEELFHLGVSTGTLPDSELE